MLKRSSVLRAATSAARWTRAFVPARNCPPAPHLSLRLPIGARFSDDLIWIESGARLLLCTDSAYPRSCCDTSRVRRRCSSCWAIQPCSPAAARDGWRAQSNPRRPQNGLSRSRGFSRSRPYGHERPRARNRCGEPRGRAVRQGAPRSRSAPRASIRSIQPTRGRWPPDPGARRTGVGVSAAHAAYAPQLSATQPPHQRPCRGAPWWSRRRCAAAR